MLSEQIIIFIQIVLIDLVLAGDNAIIIGMVASQFPAEQILYWLQRAHHQQSVPSQQVVLSLL